MGLSGWVVWYLFTLFICLMWFLSHCPADIDISKLTWILLFPSDQCAAPGVLSEAWGSLCLRGAAGSFAPWCFPAVTYGVVMAVLVVPWG